jgi:hypothetical protein
MREQLQTRPRAVDGGSTVCGYLRRTRGTLHGIGAPFQFNTSLHLQRYHIVHCERMRDSIFTHTPLSDAVNGIRLLRFLDHAPDGSLTFDLGNYVLSKSLDNAESHMLYAAIPYT